MVEECEDRFQPSRSIDHEPPETFHSGDVFTESFTFLNVLLQFSKKANFVNFVFTDVNCKFI